MKSKRFLRSLSALVALGLIFSQLSPLHADDTAIIDSEQTTEESPEIQNVEEMNSEEDENQSSNEDMNENLPDSSHDETLDNEIVEDDSFSVPKEESEKKYLSAGTLSARSGDISVNISFREGVIEEGLKLSVEKIAKNDPRYSKALNDLKVNNVNEEYAIPLDISLVDENGSSIDTNGNKYEPNGPVAVDLVMSKSQLENISDKSDVDDTSIKLLHHDDESSNTEVVAAVENNANQISVSSNISAGFDVRSFSTFTIVFNGNGTLTIKLNVVDTAGNVIEPAANTELSYSFKNNQTQTVDLAEVIANKLAGNKNQFSIKYITEDGEEKSVTNISYKRSLTSSSSNYAYTVTLLNNGTEVVKFNDLSSNPSISLKVIYTPKTSNTYDLYCYALIPGETDIDQWTSNHPDKWYYFGTGKITAENPENVTLNTTYQWNDSIQDSMNIEVPSSYPELTYKDEKYQYAAPGSENSKKKGYYTITWRRVICSNGANEYNHETEQNTTIATGHTYHLDGIIVFNEEDKLNVIWQVLPPGSTHTFQTIGSLSGQDGNKMYSALNEPDPQDYDNYYFDGWYLDENFNNKLEERDSTISVLAGRDSNGNQNSTLYLYGRYIPKTVGLKITNTVTGNMADTSKDFYYTFKLYTDKVGTSPATESVKAIKTKADGTTETLSLKHDSSFSLKHNESITIDVPYGYSFVTTQQETEAQTNAPSLHQDGYKTTLKTNHFETENTHIHSHSNLTAEGQVNYLNTKEGTVPTGLHNNHSSLMTALCALGFFSLLGVIFFINRRRTSGF